MVGTEGQQLPSGTVTFLFTDVQGSTRLWQESDEGMRASLADHDDIFDTTVKACRGYVFSTGGDGFGIAFSSAVDATDCAVAIQQALTTHDWPRGPALRVRMGMHSGRAQERSGNYFGTDVNTAARIMAVAHGGQIVVSDVTAALVSPDQLKPLGEHRLRDLEGQRALSQVIADGLAAEFPPLRSETGTTGLPAQRSPLLGRDDDTNTARRLLSAHRLVTLTGPGGVGKTRLAVEVAAREASARRDGVRFVELAPVSDADALVNALCRACGVIVDPSAPARDQALGWLARRELLLLVDNCEHVIDLAAELIDDVLDAAPRVAVLATSRESLGLDGERTQRVGGLATDDEASAAVQLFLERATAIDPDFEATAEQLTVIGEICDRLDGIPLAIELAAARTRTLDPTGIRDRLDDRFGLLVGSRKAGRRRQATLESTIDWSYDLLDANEQQMLRALSICSASFDVSVAAALASVDDLVALDLLDALVDKSLFAVSRENDEPEFRMLETIREYGMNKLLESDESVVVRDRHADHWRTWLVGPQDDWRVFLEHYLHGTGWERDVQRRSSDLLAMLNWFEQRNRLDRAAWPAAVLTGELWIAASRLEEGRVWFDRTEPHVVDMPSALRAAYFHFSAWAAGYETEDGGNVERFLRLFAEAKAAVGDPDVPRYQHLQVGFLEIAAVALSGFDARPLADATVREAQDIASGADEDVLAPYYVTDAIGFRGAARGMARDLAGALDDYDTVRDGDVRSPMAMWQWPVGSRPAYLHLLGRDDEALEALLPRGDTERIVGSDYLQMVENVVRAATGDPHEVRTAVADELDTGRGMATRHWVNGGLSQLGILAALAGEPDRARHLLERSIGFPFVHGNQLHWEYLARVADWPDDEFDERRRSQFPAVTTETLAHDRALLEDEIARLRGT